MIESVEPMLQWAQDMWSYPRSITGPGVRQTIGYLKTLIPGLEMHSILSGTKVFDWTIPPEYFVVEAFVETMDGRRVIDYADNYLHLVGYSEPVETVITKEKLESHLFSDPSKPNAIPYITSYYKDRWGFCLTHNQRENLTDEKYRVRIDSCKFTGEMNYADIVIPGKTDKEVLISTYICHPMMANDGLSGIVVSAALARWVRSMKHRRYTYRFVFVPETIGSIVYLHRNLDHMKRNTVAGYVITCCGDGAEHISVIEPRIPGTLSDRAAMSILENCNYYKYDYSQRGADERQYCWPGIDLPVSGITRSKYGEYNEYHTSLDNLDIIYQEDLERTLEFMKKCVTLIEENKTYKTVVMCEPFLRKHDMYPDTSPNTVPDVLNIMAYCDGNHDTIAIAKTLQMDPIEVAFCLSNLASKGLIE